ncbi:MAG: 4Fe-4S cluster-binding domain-containing protein [Clostridiales bacterium]|nr:4Fe-4S cluster-binding domain-containing protein [Clostridiales bacterium]
MRFSSYNIFSELIPEMGYAVLNGLSGAIDLISEELYNFMTENGTDEISELEGIPLSDDDIDEYLDRGFITEKSFEEEKDLARFIAQSIDDERKDYLVVLAVNMNCNYRCTYCFERDSECFRKNQKQILTKDQVDAIFMSLKDKEVKDPIQLFGGEPLTRETVEIVDHIISKGKEIGRSFKATTNAHDLNYFFQYLGKDMINTLQITVDGPKRIHDKRRISLDKTSSFDRIMENIKYVVREKKDVHIDLRINVDDTNIDHVEELLIYLENEGILPSGQVNPYISKVSGEDNHIANESEINRKSRILSKKYPYLSPDINISSIMNNLDLAIELGLPLQRHCAYCAMLSLKTLVFAPDEKIYACSEEIEKDGHDIGRYNKNGEILWNDKVRKYYADHKLIKNEQCISCRYALLCTGGCFKQAEAENRGYSLRHCILYQENYPRLLAEKVSERLAVLS